MTTPLACLRCRYDLRGLDPSTACPECGLAVSFSLSPPTTLAAAPPWWARRLAIGTGLLFLSAVAIPATPILFQIFMPYVARMSPAEATRRAHLYAYATTAMFLLHALAVVLVTTREPGTPRLSRRQLAIWFARIASLGPPAGISLQHYVIFVSNSSDSYESLTLTLFALYLPVPAIVFLHLRRLSARIGRPRVAEHAGIVGVGLTTCFVTFFAITFLNVFGDGFHSIVIVPAACTILFLFWGLFLLARLTVAFHRAIAEARAAWRQADATLSTPTSA